MHIQDYRFCVTTGVPPRLSGVWEIGHLRRYGVVEGRFCFEGGSSCGKGEGLYILVTDQGCEITKTLQSAAQGKLTTRKRPVSRKISTIIHGPPKSRISHISCLDVSNTNQQNFLSNSNVDVYRSLEQYRDSCQSHTSLHVCREHSDESHCTIMQPNSNADLDSDYGCGDTVSVSEMHIVQNEQWISFDNHNHSRLGQYTIPKSMTCFSKLGAPSMSRSSTATIHGTPCANDSQFNSHWTMKNSLATTCTHCVEQDGSMEITNCECSSHRNSNGNFEYSVIKQSEITRNISSLITDTAPPKSSKSIQSGFIPKLCQSVPDNKSETEPIYATVDKSKKANRNSKKSCITEESESCVLNENDENYTIIEPSLPPKDNKATVCTKPAISCENYENTCFVQSLEHYENAKQLLKKAGITQEELNHLKVEMKSENQQYASNFYGPKYCHKCGHASTRVEHNESPKAELKISKDASVDNQDDYLMMEPDTTNPPQSECVQKPQLDQHPFPGYIPMSPITNTNPTDTGENDLIRLRIKRFMGEKSASNPSLIGSAVERNRKRSDLYTQIPEVENNSPNCQKLSLLPRKRSRSADASRYIEEDADDLDNSLTPSQETSLSTETLRKISLSSLNNYSSQIEHRLSPPCLPQEIEHCFRTKCYRKLSIDVNSNETEGDDNSSLTSDSLRTQIATTQRKTINIRRSASVPCKFGKNRESSSSNDSGVGSLKHQGADFAEFEFPLTVEMTSRRHYYYAKRLAPALINCMHFSLPRRSKSFDPLRELTFQFQDIKIPTKSSSAEAEIPICQTKSRKGFSSSADTSNLGSTCTDSRSTSSGTSDMSDYIESLSLSSHSSSDAADLRFIRPTTKLRPRSGKEYHNIDRSLLVLQTYGNGIWDEIQRDPSASSYAKITPFPEKPE